ncbi:MAG: thioredoxin [Muribaculum sp.]|nr:thioredoxin [Muribaculaceae bacterium]MCM1080894.1 thioredoxin [Muribaculum sp.]
MKKFLFAIITVLVGLSASAQSGTVKSVSDSTVTADIIDYMVSPPVIKSNLPVVIDLWAPWCGPCRRLAPVIDELAKEYAGKVAFYKINVDENPLTAMAFRVQSIPMLIFIPTNGKQINAVLGLQPKENLQRVIDEYLLTK